jgi:hypothetical protein
MANGWALGKFGGELAQVAQTYLGQLQSGLFLRAYFAYTASDVCFWHKTEPIALSDVRFGGKADITRTSCDVRF